MCTDRKAGCVLTQIEIGRIVVPDIFPAEWVQAGDDEHGVLIGVAKRGWYGKCKELRIEFVVPGGWPRGPGYRCCRARHEVSERIHVGHWEIEWPRHLYPVHTKWDFHMTLGAVMLLPGDSVVVDPIEIEVIA